MFHDWPTLDVKKDQNNLQTPLMYMCWYVEHLTKIIEPLETQKSTCYKLL